MKFDPITPTYGERLKNGKFKIEDVTNPEAVVKGDSVPLDRMC